MVNPFIVASDISMLFVLKYAGGDFQITSSSLLEKDKRPRFTEIKIRFGTEQAKAHIFSDGTVNLWGWERSDGIVQFLRDYSNDNSLKIVLDDVYDDDTDCIK